MSKKERSLSEERWFRNKGNTLEGQQSSEGVTLRDGYFSGAFYVPGVLIARDRVYPTGTVDALAGQPPDLNKPPETIANHAVTPMTDRSARHFYSAGVHRSFGNEVTRDQLLERVRIVFSEDRSMIEAQQRIIDATRDKGFMLTTSDKGIVMYNRLVQELCTEGARAEC